MAPVKIHVMPHPDGGWQIKREGSNKAVGKYATKKEAMARARELSGNSDSHIVEHGTNGTIKGVSKSAQNEKVNKVMINVNIHIRPNPKGGWQVMREGSNKSIGNFKNKEEAMARARELSGNSDSKIIEHAMDGSIKSVSKSKQAKKAALKKETKPAKKAATKKPVAKKTTPKKETKPATKKATTKKETKPAKKKVVVVKSGIVINKSKDKVVVKKGTAKKK